MHTAAAVAFLVMAVACTRAAVDYPIDWATVPATAPAATNTRTLDFGNCMCDTTAGCDANCCCDRDCTTEGKFFGPCKKTVAGTSQVIKCVDRNSGTDIVNSQEEVAYQEPVAGDAVCVVSTNLPVGMDEFWNLPSDAGVARMVATPRDSWPPRPTLTPTALKANDRLPFYSVRLEQGGTWRSAIDGDGYVKVPRAAGTNGACNFDRAVRFLEEEYHTCNLAAPRGVAAPLEALCAGDYNVNKYKFWALTPPGHTLRNVNNIVGVVVNVRDSNGNLIDTADPTTTVRSELTGSAGVRAASTARQLQQTAAASTSFASGVCRSAVIATKLHVFYEMVDAGSRIFNASVDLTVADVATAGPYRLTSEVKFTRVGHNENTAVPRRSGNPGYVAGARVQVGRLVSQDPASPTSKTAIAARMRGFALPAGHLCSQKQFVGVPFAHDVQQTGCGVALTEAQLDALCLQPRGTEALLQDALTPTGDGANISYIVDRFAMSANARADRPSDWIPVMGMPWAVTDRTSSYTRAARQCPNLVVGLRWVIGVARAGVDYNPQDVIIGVRVEPIMGTWKFRGSGNTTINYFKFEASFVRVAEDAGVSRQEVIPPNILPTVTEDVFYPFRRPGARTRDTAN